MKVRIKEVNNVFAWSWQIPNNTTTEAIDFDQSTTDVDSNQDDICGICRLSYNSACPACKFPGDQCPLVIGACHHNFHVHCIYQWLDSSTSRGLCPMCRQVFKLQKGFPINDTHTLKFKHLMEKRRQDMQDMQDSSELEGFNDFNTDGIPSINEDRTPEEAHIDQDLVLR